MTLPCALCRCVAALARARAGGVLSPRCSAVAIGREPARRDARVAHGVLCRVQCRVHGQVIRELRTLRDIA